MAGLFDDEKQADMYADARPSYPAEWYSKLAALTSHHRLAIDFATGNGQAALGVAEHYEQVIGTDMSETQLQRAAPHPQVRYLHTPLTMSEDELVSLIGSGDNSVDLITVAQAVHWFDLPKFYSLVRRLLRNPGGVVAVWGYYGIAVSPEFDLVMDRFHVSTLPFWDRKIEHIFDRYKSLPFPFEGVGGLGSEGAPLALDIPKELSFRGFLKFVGSWSGVVTAKAQGVDLLSDEVIKQLETAWGGPTLVRSLTHKAFMLAGKIRV